MWPLPAETKRLRKVVARHMNGHDLRRPIQTGNPAAVVISISVEPSFTWIAPHIGRQLRVRVVHARVGYYNDNWDPKAASDFKLSWYSTPPPSFNSAEFSPQSAAPGTKITLSGTNFTGATRVLFNGASAIFANAATTNLDLRIVAVVPPDAVSGPITIVTAHGDVTSSDAFQVLPPGLSANLRSPGEIAVTWPATSNAFVLEASDSLTSPVWTQLTNHTFVLDGLTEVKIPLLPGNRFFRLRTK
jgi:hypothetical protein